MLKSKTRRHRHRRNKLSRRMKKRGGGHHHKSTQIRPSASSIKSTITKRGPLFERFGVNPEFYVKMKEAFDSFKRKYQRIQDEYIGYDQYDNPVIKKAGLNWVEVSVQDLEYNEATHKWEIVRRRRQPRYQTDLLRDMTVTVTHPGEFQWDPETNSYTDTPTPSSIAFLAGLKWLRVQNREGRFWIPRDVAEQDGFL